MWRNKKGFTLIELLIVIVILGILAIAILSAINPIEQINKATDSGKQSDASELINALERHYASNQEWAWDAAGDSEPTDLTQASSLSLTLEELVNSDEVKSEFQDRASMDDIYIKLVGSGSSQYVMACFEPKSNTYQDDDDPDHYDPDTQVGGGANGVFCVPGVE